ncbi:uncharacterized protein LACBIDRAFT_305592 [Laccaria bicolor S238N-H82]|uniref:Predicted protein n=1 Tax=Laccaria bicolor (strain S238N-H82 / ATCC MYA-4686) TaxID=486041 RepID=B0CUM3_LACBS|nr:uncharacterized protein LACBIDRAFT_305592 [Laccaria bicolor S238N-H82]EDR14115.1 predicted protein [Laccaria bicolor S238N-H82]|eukprot:XP_001874674.1 predicted protein [Laccaria bicolor S238N-H82]
MDLLGSASQVYEMDRPSVQISVLQENRVYEQKLSSTRTTFRVCETSRPTVQSRCSVLQRNQVFYQKMRPTGTTTRAYET